ncbi:MAG: DUF3667 domain-containing protein [Ferruginibacter sp.]
MSHLKEREEKNCLNCNAVIYGKYCHICGQENIHPKESAWHLVTHFFQDITHFDGKFFSTLKLLIFRPGFLSREYMNGRRANYLNPIRMYVFSSAIFFIIFFSVFHVDENTLKINGDTNGVAFDTINAMDSAAFSKFTAGINFSLHKDSMPMTREEFKEFINRSADSGTIKFFRTSTYRTKESYDSALSAGTIHDGWIKRTFMYKQIELSQKYRGKQRELISVFANMLLHSTPQLLFVSLPLFALLLQLLYVRRKQYYYVNHAIFTVHLFIFIFIALLAIFGINELSSLTNYSWLKYISILIGLLIIFYNYKAMRNFYQQGRAKTIFKLLLLHTANFFIILILFVFFVFFSLFKI